jgi:N-acetylglucosamine kinase-like BadF-type ATPase
MNNRIKNFFIGMDGGGTKTHAMIANAQGEVLAEHIGGPSNFQIIGVEKASETIFSLIQSCCESVGCVPKDIASIACGLTGAGRAGDQQRMADGLKRYALKKKSTLKNIIIESDARVALEGAFKGEPGIILIAGTGSIAFGKDAKGMIHRVGGWGRILGDEGSGYYIGRLGLTAVTRHIDGRGGKTMLTNMLAKKFNLADQTAIINAVYKNGFDVASVAPAVIEAAQKKDEVCKMIIEQAVIELAEHVRIASEKILASSKTKIKSKVRLAFIGGLIANQTLLSELLRRYLQERIPFVSIIEPMASPAYGAVVLAVRTKGKK